MANVSPGEREWIYLDAFPPSYFFIKKVSSPLELEGEMGVYGLTTFFPLESFSASGSDDLTTTQDATGSKDAWLSGSSKMNLADDHTCETTTTQVTWRRRLTWLYCGYMVRLF